MEFQVIGRPAAALAVVRMDLGDELVAEKGSLVSATGNVFPTTTLLGAHGRGPLALVAAVARAWVRSWLGGEAAFVNVLRAHADGEEVTLAPPMPGDVAIVEVSAGQPLYVDAGAWLAAEPAVEVSLGVQGMAFLVGGEGLFLLTCRGQGRVLFHAYGAIERVPVDGALLVDGGHLVAWQGALTWRVRMASRSWGATVLSGEGTMVELRGQGTAWIQTRSLDALARALHGRVG